MKWIDGIPWIVLIPAALLLALAPFSPEPHLWQKLKMLVDGALVRPMDIFDLIFHGSGVVLVTAKAARQGRAHLP